eukprot:5058666-Pyramimonas_sp.AAC.1
MGSAVAQAFKEDHTTIRDDIGKAKSTIGALQTKRLNAAREMQELHYQARLRQDKIIIYEEKVR